MLKVYERGQIDISVPKVGFVQPKSKNSFSAFTCDEGLNDLRTDLLLRRRTMVQPGDTALDIALRARFGWSVVNWVVPVYVRDPVCAAS